MIRTVVVGALAVSLMASVAPTAQAQGLGALGNIFNCNRTGSNQTAGALIGGALGGLAGAGVAKNDTLGGILGAVVGAAAGSYIGCSMGTRDQASLEDATLRALNENRPTDWSNPQTGAAARINVYADTSTPQYGSGYGNNAGYNTPRYGDRMSPQSIRFGNRINASASFETVAPRQIALTDTFIRMSPSAAAQSNGSLRPNEEFQAIAKVVGQDWLLVGRNGEAIGYVPASAARASGETVTSTNGYAQPISAQSLRLGRNVSWANAYEAAPSLFTVRSTGNLRAAPSTQARSLGQVSRGSQVEGLARVRGTPWILVGRNGEGIGYVSDTLLQAQAGYQQPGYQQPGYTQASNDCRIVEQVVTTREQGTQTARLRACRAPGSSSGWTFAQA